MTGLTQQQARALTYLRDFTAMNGYCPSYAEIAKHVGLKGKSGVARLVNELEERGNIRRLPGRARAIEVIMPRTAELSPEIDAMVRLYATAHRISKQTAVNELLRHALGAVA
jgi:SOS-response transcriptional repressor LexA